jgi:hypothetical protein
VFKVNLYCRQKQKKHIRNGHSEDTAFPHSQKVMRRREHGYTMISLKTNRRHKQLKKLRTRGVSTLEGSVAKQFASGGLNQVLGCTNLTLAPTGSQMNKQAQVVLAK